MFMCINTIQKYETQTPNSRLLYEVSTFLVAHKAI